MNYTLVHKHTLVGYEKRSGGKLLKVKDWKEVANVRKAVKAAHNYPEICKEIHLLSQKTPVTIHQSQDTYRLTPVSRHLSQDTSQDISHKTPVTRHQSRPSCTSSAWSPIQWSQAASLAPHSNAGYISPSPWLPFPGSLHSALTPVSPIQLSRGTAAANTIPSSQPCGPQGPGHLNPDQFKSSCTVNKTVLTVTRLPPQ